METTAVGIVRLWKRTAKKDNGIAAVLSLHAPSCCSTWHGQPLFLPWSATGPRCSSSKCQLGSVKFVRLVSTQSASSSMTGHHSPVSVAPSLFAPLPSPLPFSSNLLPCRSALPCRRLVDGCTRNREQSKAVWFARSRARKSSPSVVR